MENDFSRLIYCYLMIMIIFFSFSTVSLSLELPDNSRNVIRVARIDLSSYHNRYINNDDQGYGDLYLKEISKYTGWTYDFVDCTFEQGLIMLDNGEVDLIGGVAYSNELAQHYDFAELESGISYTVLCINIYNKDIAYNDFEVFDGMTVGILSDSNLYQNFVNFSDVNHFSAKPVFFSNMASLLNSLNLNKVDAILTSSLEVRPTEKVISQFSPVPFYFITSKGNNKILDQLNFAQEQIKINNPYFESDLFRKYFDVNEKSSEPVFTLEEQSYIKNSGTIDAVFDPAWAPIEFYDENTKSFSGITSDIFKYISEKSGIKFHFIETDTFSESLKIIKSGGADLICGIGNDTNWADEHNITLSDPYFSSSILLIKNNDVSDPQNVTAALTTDYLAATEYVKRLNPTLKIKYYDTVEDCFTAVADREADITYANSYVTTLQLMNPKMNNLMILESANLTDQLCIGVSNNQDPILLSILNKTIRSISDSQLNTIIYNNTLGNESVVTLETLLYTNPSYIILFLSLLFLMIVAIFSFIIYTKNIYNAKIERLAYIDALTGIDNYTKFNVEADAFISNSNYEYALIYIDINNFSYINNTFGYKVGDEILKTIAQVFDGQLKKHELAARISADNFVCLFEYIDQDKLFHRYMQICEQCNDIIKKRINQVRITMLCGIYIIEPGETNISLIVNKASIAHKSIIDINQGSIAFYDDKIHNKILKNNEIENQMHAALENREFFIKLQPKVRLSDYTIVGAEALVRWHHPEKGIIKPDEFIPLFESNGFIIDLDFYVYNETCKILRKWLDEGKIVVPVSVNVSKAHLASHNFAFNFKNMVGKYDISPKLIELELTESIFLHNPKEVVTMINYLKETGFSISIDDFGSGYSSLTLLKDLPVDVLKIDKEFFRKEGMEEKDRCVVDGIINIAKELDLNIISEGVETGEQVDFLVRAGCDMAQGYFFSKPLTVEEFEKLINHS